VPIIRPIDRWFAEEIFPHEARFHAAARRICKTREEAEDLVQEALTRLFAINGWGEIVNPPAYVLQMLRHIAIERMRRQRVVDFQQLMDTDQAPSPYRVAAGRDALRRAGEMVAALPERCRTVLVRRRVHGESASAIARDLGISQSTFEKRLGRAIQLLAASALVDDAPFEPEGAERRGVTKR
jgi:RNA polymerase sigma factor (sigma-70 family)